MTADEPRGIPGGGENAQSWRHREIAAAFAPLEVSDAVAQADKFARIARLWKDGVAAFERATRDSARWSGAAADASSAAVGSYVAEARELTAVLDRFSVLVRTAADAIVATKYAIPEQVAVAEMGPPWLATGQAESHRAAIAALEDARLAMRERYVVPFGEIDARIPVLPMPSRRGVPGGDSDDRLLRGGRSAEIFGENSGSGVEDGLTQVKSLNSPHSPQTANLPPTATSPEGVATTAQGGGAATSDDGSTQGGDLAGTKAGSAGPDVSSVQGSESAEPGNDSAGSGNSPGPGADSTMSGDSSTIGSELAEPGNDPAGSDDSAGPHGGSTERGDHSAVPGESSVRAGDGSVRASNTTMSTGGTSPAPATALIGGPGSPGVAAGALSSVVDPIVTSVGRDGSAHPGGAQPAWNAAPTSSGDQSGRGIPSLPLHDAEQLRPGAGRSMAGAVGPVVGANSPIASSPARMLDRLFHCAVSPGAGQAPDSDAERVLPDYLVTQANTDALLGNPRPTVSGGVIGGGDGG
ncbi:hypothetical protein [Nocardia rhizosphaerihabitans]|uniref:PPE family domain-containing protein n=1 Tax=Nocardia rhizosphaerihabitans TaxID=1691570 RepID=A0ABQ2KSC5_9NOCA|nr:hypothetical protein [Nocardia rhizosphaerihabitans]GGN91609.1 hypothetical protein GCM10011610_52000 [Nocardia rhizosphaerihabitans]